MVKLNTNPFSYCKITMVCAIESEGSKETIYEFRNGILMNLVNHAFVLYSSASVWEIWCSWENFQIVYYISDHFLSFETATASKDSCDIIYHA